MLVTHSDILFAGNKAWGDKDLFRLAFALSGNSDSYYQARQPSSVQLASQCYVGKFVLYAELQNACAGLGSPCGTLSVHNPKFKRSEGIIATVLRECSVV